ncbi:MAG TPA: hypothetical protein VKB55_09585 [Nocardioidaceae bacterium]|nr:hypothetical protein [Nocardioidaceae bacterium]
MTEADISEWANFGVGVAGATAALTGLLFVAVSINLDRILQFRTLPRLAGATLLMFSGALVSALLLLMPGQAPAALGTELVVIALGVGGPLVRLQTKTPRYEAGTTEVAWVLTRLLPSLLVSGLLAASGVTMWAEWSDALYLLGAGVTLAIVAGLVNSWVLLVEIQR